MANEFNARDVKTKVRLMFKSNNIHTNEKYTGL